MFTNPFIKLIRLIATRNPKSWSIVINDKGVSVYDGFCGSELHLSHGKSDVEHTIRRALAHFSRVHELENK